MTSRPSSLRNRLALVAVVTTAAWVVALTVLFNVLLASQLQTQIKREECRSLIGRGIIDNQVVELVKPQTYMNLSGEAVSCLLAKDERSVERLIASFKSRTRPEPRKVGSALA